MSANSSQTTERTEFEGEREDDRRRLLDRATDLAARRARDGTLAMLAGGALFARAVRARTRWRAVAGGLAGLALVGLGVRQRLSGGDAREREQPTPPGSGTSHPGDGDASIDLSDTATAAEPGEAVGPNSEQAEPTMTEDTEPEESPQADVSHVEADVPGEGSAEDDADEDAATDASDAGATDE